MAQKKDSGQKQGADDAAKHSQPGLNDITRELWLAGLGVLSTVEEEGVKWYNKFVEKGQQLVDKGRQYEKKDRGVTAKVSETADFVETRVKAAMESLKPSSRNDIKELQEKVDKLAQTVAVLSRKLDRT